MLSIDEIRIEHALGPVLTDNPQPRFSFSLTSDRRESSLRSAHILVGGWRMEVIEACCTVYNGPALEPLRVYPVRVIAVDDAGETAEAETSFQTGRLDLPWQASWISDPDFHEFSSAHGLSSPLSGGKGTGAALHFHQLYGHLRPVLGRKTPE